MDHLPAEAEQLCAASPYDFSDLKAVFVNCTLKRSPEISNTEGLADLSMTIMRRTGVEVELIRPIDHEIATGVWPDMTEHGWERDAWPSIHQRVMVAPTSSSSSGRSGWVTTARSPSWSSSGSTPARACSTTPASTPTPGGWGAA